MTDQREGVPLKKGALFMERLSRHLDRLAYAFFLRPRPISFAKADRRLA